MEAAAPAEGELDESPPECRICRCGTENGPLRRPCLCSGSVRWVHQECLEKWLETSGKTKCELCGYPFSWTQLYRPGTPDRLPTREVLRELGIIVLEALDLALRAVLSILSYAVRAHSRVAGPAGAQVLTPIATMWVWRLFLAQSLDVSSQWQQISVGSLVADALCGSLVSVSLAMALHVLGVVEAEGEAPEGALVLAPGLGSEPSMEEGAGTPAEEVDEEGPQSGFQRVNVAVELATDGLEDNPSTIRLEFHHGYAWIWRNALLVLVSNSCLVGLFLAPPIIAARLVALTLQNAGDQARLVAAVVTGYTIVLSGSVAWPCQPVELRVSQAELALDDADPAPPENAAVQDNAEPEPGYSVGTLTAVLAKVVFMLGCETLIFPLGCGLLIDLCALSALSSGGLVERKAFLARSPFLFIFAHWLVGFVFMLLMAFVHTFLMTTFSHDMVPMARQLNAQQETAMEGDFWGALMAARVSDLALSSLLYVPLILCLVWVPIQINMVLCPWIFPISISAAGSSTFGFPAELIAFHIVMPFLLEYRDMQSQLSDSFTFLLHKLAETLGVSPYLFDHDADLRNAQESRTCIRTWLCLGCFFLGTLALVMVLIAYTMSVSIILGRLELQIMQLGKSNDLLAFAFGLCSVWILLRLLAQASCASFESISNAAVAAFTTLARGAAFLCILVLWGCVIPMLVGILVELCIGVHIRLGLSHRTPCFALHQDWVLGLFVLKWWVRSVTLIENREGESDHSWRNKFNQVYDQDGAVRTGFVLCEIIAPVGLALLVALSVPYTATTVLLDAGSTAIAIRLSYLGCCATATLYWLTMKGYQLLRYIHNKIRDKKYSIGSVLHDRDPEEREASEQLLIDSVH